MKDETAQDAQPGEEENEESVGREATKARLIPAMYGLEFSLVSKKPATRYRTKNGHR